MPQFKQISTTISMMVGLAAATGAHAASNWDETLAKAKGGEVRFSVWSGSENINSWIDKWVAPRMAELYGVKVRRQPAKDPVDQINKLVSEKQAGKTKGSTDLMWVNGENFKLAKAAGTLYGPFTEQLPSFTKYYDTKSTAITLDFGTPVEGYEAPYGKAQFVFVYDSAKVKVPPRSYPELKEWIKSNPGRFAYPSPPDFTGSAFVRQVMYATTGGAQQFLPKVDLELLRQKVPATWAWLNEVRPHLWMKGATYPESKARLDQLFADGEIWLSMGYSPTTAEADIRKGVLPKTVKTFVMKEGTIANTHFVAIPFNAPNREAGLVLANFLLSPEAQLAKFDPASWGDFPALDVAKVEEPLRKKFETMDLGSSTLPVSELSAHQLPEIQPEYLVEIEKLWAKSVASKGGSN